MTPNTETPRDTAAYMRGYEQGYAMATSMHGQGWWTWVEVVLVLVVGAVAGDVLRGLL